MIPLSSHVLVFLSHSLFFLFLILFCFTVECTTKENATRKLKKFELKETRSQTLVDKYAKMNI